MGFFFPLKLGVPRAKFGGDSSIGESVWRENVGGRGPAYDLFDESTVFNDIKTSTSQDLHIVLGEPGAGKTSLLQAWFARSAQDVAVSPSLGQLVPILIRLRHVPAKLWKTNSEHTLADLLWSFGRPERAAIEPERFCGTGARLFRQGHGRHFQPLWLFDGLDELHESISNNRRVYKQLVALPGRKVVSIRTAVYRFLRGAIAEHVKAEYTLMGLEREQQLGFLQIAMQERGDSVAPSLSAEDLLAQIHGDEAIRSLAGNPLLLSLMMEVGITQSGDGVTPSRAAFYKHAVDRLWHRKLSGEPPLLRIRDEREAFLTRKASEMGLSKFRGKSDASPRLEQALRMSGLIRMNDEDGTLEFIHLTFQEYYLAKSLCSENLTSVLHRYWDKARLDETLSLLLSLAFTEGRDEEVAEALEQLIKWGRDAHRTSPQELWRIGRSPFRVALHILSRSGIPLETDSLASLRHLLSTIVANGSDTLKVALTSDPAFSPSVSFFLAANDVSMRQNLAWNHSRPISAALAALLSDDSDYYVRDSLLDKGAVASEVLVKWAADSNDKLLASIASDPNAPTELLVDFANKKRFLGRLAANPSTPPNIVRRLAEHKDQYIRSQVANNPNASDDILLLLSEEWEPQIEDRLQKRKPLSPRLLAGLAHSPSASMRLFVAKHAEASAESLTALASDPWIDIRMAVATNANTPLDKLVELASDKTAEVRTTVASIPLLSQEIFPRLANDKSEYVRASVAANPATPTMVLDKLSRDRSWRVRYRLAKNPSLAANIITRFSRYNFLRLAVAENRCASPKDLRRLSVSKDYKVRAAVASNPNTPIDILEMLSHDDHYDGQVQLAVCKSKYGDEIFTGRLLHDAAWRVVDYFASNGRTAPHLLLELVASDHHTRRRLATNWSVPPSGLAKLAEDEDQEVRSFVASNGNTPPQALDVLLTRCLSEKDRPSPWPGVSTSHRMQRWGVARHENSLPETLARLVHDPDESVREQVAENLNSILEDL